MPVSNTDTGHRSAKKPEQELGLQPIVAKSSFFEEVSYIQSKGKDPRGWSTANSLTATWRDVLIPDIVRVASAVLERLYDTPAPQLSKSQEEEKGFEVLKNSLLESKNIEIVRKKNFFNEEVTEEEREIIAQRVALQQRQFAAYEVREKARKSNRIRTVFDYVTDEEITELLNDSNQDEDEVIYNLTKPGYLSGIRKTIALKYADEESNYAPVMSNEQRTAYQQLLKKRKETLKKTINADAKKRYRTYERLGLDEALEKLNNNEVDPEKAFEGWSEARVKAYQMIEQNPNSYYYRFNAPGEIQRRGQWDEDEKELFHKRLAEVGANGQWGIFSMKIPGRVGYQCSNYYRLLIETHKISDPNYVLDEKGKAHFLFEKKSSDGQVKKTFRTHTKLASVKKKKEAMDTDTVSDDSTPEQENIAEPSSSKTVPADLKRRKSSPSAVADEAIPTTKTSKTTPKTNTNPSTAKSHAAASSSSTPSTPTTPKPVTVVRKRRRVVRTKDDDTSDDYDDDYSGSFTTRAKTVADDRRRSKRQRRPTAHAIESGLASQLLGIQGEDDYLREDSDDNDNEDDESCDPTCPLPGFIDPITLEQIIKPAISKYGHVMGYDSWIRCLNNWEGQRNICPLTKKPLTKRDLVILTFENIEEYRNQIVNI